MRGSALSERIIERLQEMPPQLALGARFIVDHPDVMVMSSMREIAGRVGVAPATLLRLARMLGYEDWSDFRDVYVEHFRSSSPHYAEKADALSKRQGGPCPEDYEACHRLEERIRNKSRVVAQRGP